METPTNSVPLTQAELFKAELETLLKKYPTITLNIQHQIDIREVTPEVIK